MKHELRYINDRRLLEIVQDFLNKEEDFESIALDKTEKKRICLAIFKPIRIALSEVVGHWHKKSQNERCMIEQLLEIDQVEEVSPTVPKKGFVECLVYFSKMSVDYLPKMGRAFAEQGAPIPEDPVQQTTYFSLISKATKVLIQEVHDVIFNRPKSILKDKSNLSKSTQLRVSFQFDAMGKVKDESSQRAISPVKGISNV